MTFFHYIAHDYQADEDNLEEEGRKYFEEQIDKFTRDDELLTAIAVEITLLSSHLSKKYQLINLSFISAALALALMSSLIIFLAHTSYSSRHQHQYKNLKQKNARRTLKHTTCLTFENAPSLLKVALRKSVRVTPQSLTVTYQDVLPLSLLNWLVDWNRSFGLTRMIVSAGYFLTKFFTSCLGLGFSQLNDLKS